MEQNGTLKQRLLFSIYDKIGVKLLTMLRLKFIHLNELKFCHKLSGCVSPMCYRGAEIKTTKRLYCVDNFLSVRAKSL